MIGFLVSSVFLRLGLVTSSSTAAAVERHRMLWGGMEYCVVTRRVDFDRVDVGGVAVARYEANLLVLLPLLLGTLSRVLTVRAILLLEAFIMLLCMFGLS